MSILKETTSGEINQLLCESCKHETNHKTLTSIDSSISDEEYGTYFKTSYQIVQCQGCNRISFRMLSCDYENIDLTTGDPIIEEIIYPKRTKETISRKFYHNLPDNLHNIYLEIIDCFNNGNLILAGAGFRVLIEGICLDNNIQKGQIQYIDEKDGIQKIKNSKNLDGKINGLFEKGILTKKDSILLQEFRFLGNDSVHYLIKPKKRELSLAFSIIEHVINSIYIIPEKGTELIAIGNKKRKK